MPAFSQTMVCLGEWCWHRSLQSSVSFLSSEVQDEQPQLSQPILVGEVFHPWDHFCGPPLDVLQQVHISPVLRTPHLDAVLQVRPHRCRVERRRITSLTLLVMQVF